MRAIVALTEPRRTLPSPTFSLLPTSHRDFTAQIVGRQPPAIEVAQAFAAELRDELRAHAEQLAGVALMKPLTSTAERRAVAAAAQDIACSFVVLHELFHLVGGHIVWLAASKASPRRAFDEVRMGMSLTSTRSTRTPTPRVTARTLRSYYLEVEADNSALQCQMQSDRAVSLKPLLKRGSPPIADLTGRDRQVVFRLLLSVVWVVVRIMETRRHRLLQRQALDHPLPAARLLAVVATLMEQYARLTELRADAKGRKIQSLNARQLVLSQEFLRQIVKPVLSVQWTLPGASPAQRAFDASVADLARDIGQLLLMRGGITRPGIELEKIEALRHEMTAALAPHRYLVGHDGAATRASGRQERATEHTRGRRR